MSTADLAGFVAALAGLPQRLDTLELPWACRPPGIAGEGATQEEADGVLRAMCDLMSRAAPRNLDFMYPSQEMCSPTMAAAFVQMLAAKGVTMEGSRMHCLIDYT